jgi:hypothetical protein
MTDAIPSRAAVAAEIFYSVQREVAFQVGSVDGCRQFEDIPPVEQQRWLAAADRMLEMFA